jgi:hypothetical protein
MNKERLQAIIDRIEADPTCWYQKTWHCQTAHCVAGHAQIDSGRPISDATVRGDAREWLDLSSTDANWLFSPSRTLADFKQFVRDGYDRAGYNRAGYDSDGYDCDGYDRAGYDRAGYDCDGYDCDGYGNTGYDRTGYDRTGYDRTGYDSDGLDVHNKRKPATA